MNERQMSAGRDQLAMERELIAQGMSPQEAALEAGMRALRARQAEWREGMPRTPDGRPAPTPQEAAFDEDMALAMGQEVSYGNGAEVDNLEAAATPIVMERALVPGSSAALIAGPQNPKTPCGFR